LQSAAWVEKQAADFFIVSIGNSGDFLHGERHRYYPFFLIFLYGTIAGNGIIKHYANAESLFGN